MAKLSADLNESQGFQVLPKDTYNARIDKVKSQVREGRDGKFRDLQVGEESRIVEYLANGGAVMLSVAWQPDDAKAPDFMGSIFDNVMVAGVSGAQAKKPGTKLSTERLCEYINALRVDWTCNACAKTSNTGFALENGKSYCPACGKPAVFDFDPDTFIDRVAVIQVDVGADQKGKPRNEVGQVRPIA